MPGVLLLYCYEDVKSHRSGGDTVLLKKPPDIYVIYESHIYNAKKNWQKINFWR